MNTSFNKELVDKVPVVHFSDFKNIYENGEKIEFNSFSWGDAVLTLMDPKSLIKDLKSRNHENKFNPLIEELESVPKGYLIGFEG